MAVAANALTDVATLRTALGLPALQAPGTPTVTPQGTPASTTYSYRIVATNATETTAAGATGSTTTGAATLNSTNYTTVTWAAVAGATGYKVYRTVGAATQGCISTIRDGATVTLDDTGLTGDSSTVPTSATAAALERLIDGASGALERLTGRRLASRTYSSVTLDGTGTATLLLPSPPVTSVTALTINSADFGTTYTVSTVLGDDEVRLDADTGRVTLLSNAPVTTFLAGYKNITVTYLGGYDTSTYVLERKALEEACIELAHMRLKAQERDPGYQSQSHADWNFTLLNARQLPQWTAQVVRQFKMFRLR